MSRPARARLALLGVGLAITVASSGCTSFEMTRLANHIDRDVPEAEIGEGFALSFGALTMGSARTALALADDGDESTEVARAMLRHVKRVQIGTYEVRGNADLSRIRSPRVFAAYERDGWVPVVTVRETDEVVWIMAREKHDDLRDLLVVLLDHEELMVAKLSGNLSRAVAAAFQESNWAFDLAHGLSGADDDEDGSPDEDLSDDADESH